jgi:hypothetical protein
LAEQHPPDLLELANGQVRAAHALREDLLAVLFPHGDVPPSELLQTRVKLKLLALIDGIERQLLGQSGEQRSWEMLARSGLLREKALVHFALARIAEERIVRTMQAAGASPLAQLPAKLLQNDNVIIAEMAGRLLQAEANSSDETLYLRLNAEMLHLLVWRVVAVLQQSALVDGLSLTENAKLMLAAHNPDADLSSAARKLAFFLGPDYREALLQPEKSGLSLFVANLSQSSGVDSDLIYRLIHEGTLEPLALMLRANDRDAEQLSRIIATLRGMKHEMSAELIERFAGVDAVDARAAISGWQSEGSAS